MTRQFLKMSEKQQTQLTEHIKHPAWLTGLFSREALPGWVIFFLALFVRAVHQWFIQQNDPMFGYLLTGGDNHTFDRWALEISQTFWLGWDRTPFFHGPLYPYVLGLFYLRFGYSPLTAAWMQHGIGSLSAVLVFYLARKAFNQKTGWIAGIIAVFCPIFLLYECEILSDTLILFTNLLLLWAAFHAAESQTKKAWFLLGLATGVAALGRPNALILIPVIALWLWVSVKKTWKTKTSAAVLFTFTAVACILPATCANYFAGKHFALVSWSGPFNLYIGNAPDGTGVFWSPPSMQKIRAEEKKPDLEINWSRYMRQALLDDPLLLPRSLWLKFRLFWQSGEIPHNINVYLKKPFSPFLRIPLYWGMIAPLGILGFFWTVLRKKTFSWTDPVLILGFFFAVYMAGIVLVFVLARLRMPALAVLIIFAAGALSQMLDLCREARVKRSMRPVAMILLLLLLWSCGGVLLKSRDDTLLLRWNDYFNLGSAYESKNRRQEALEQYEKAVERAPEIIAIQGVRDEMRRQLEQRQQ
jgi:4-amino-4-deoxy-L-arabinose transferase-like glycosyltransferase